MRAILIVSVAAIAGAVHYAHGLPAGWSAYLFLGVLVLSSGMYTRGMRGRGRGRGAHRHTRTGRQDARHDG
jgi:hypothetical protein